MVRKHYYNFRYKANMLNLRSRDLTVHNTVLLDIWWNTLFKFSKHIGNSLAKIINTKVNSRLC